MSANRSDLEWPASFPRSPFMNSVLLIHRSERQKLVDSVIRVQPRTLVTADTEFHLAREAGVLAHSPSSQRRHVACI